MRAFVTIIILIAVLAFIFVNQSNLDVSNDGYVVKGLSEIRQLIGYESNTKGDKTTVYKYKDKNGDWVFTDKPTADNSESEQLQYYSDTNTIPALRKQQLEKLKHKANSDNSPDEKTNPLEKTLNVVNDARSIEGDLQKREQQQDQIINQ